MDIYGYNTGFIYFPLTFLLFFSFSSLPRAACACPRAPCVRLPTARAHYARLLCTFAAPARCTRSLCTLALSVHSVRSNVQRNCSKKLCTAPLHSASLNSVPLCSVHGYARVHTSVYIYTHTHSRISGTWCHVPGKGY